MLSRRAAAARPSDAPPARDDVENLKPSTAVRRRRWTDQLRYSLDERSLAAFRIFIAAIYLHDAWEHWDDLELFYTDGGLAPREAGVSSYTWTGILNWPWSLSHWSVLQLGGSLAFVEPFFVAHIAALLALLLGWRTRLAAPVVWVCLASLNQRNAYVTHTFDQYTAGLLLFCVLGDLPLGARFSLDRRRAPASPTSGQVATVGAFALRVQVALLYICAVANKEWESWVSPGRAVCMVWTAPQVCSRLGPVLHAWFPGMCVWASRGGIALEAAAATLLLVPHSGAQAAAFVAQLLLHGGIWATLTLDEVPLINLAAGCIFATPAVWELVVALLRRAGLDKQAAIVAGGGEAPTPRVLPSESCGGGSPCGAPRRAAWRRLRPLAVLRALPAVVALALAVHVHAARFLVGPRAPQPLLPFPFGHLQVALGISSQYFAVFSRVSNLTPRWPSVRGTHVGAGYLTDHQDIDALASVGTGAVVPTSGLNGPVPTCEAAGGLFNGCIFRNGRWRKLWESIDFYWVTSPPSQQVAPMRALGLYLCDHWRHPVRLVGLASLEFASRMPQAVKLGDLDCATRVFTLAPKYHLPYGMTGVASADGAQHGQQRQGNSHGHNHMVGSSFFQPHHVGHAGDVGHQAVEHNGARATLRPATDPLVHDARRGWFNPPPTELIQAEVVAESELEATVTARLDRDGFALVRVHKDGNHKATVVYGDDALVHRLKFLGAPYHPATPVLKIIPEDGPRVQAAGSLSGLEFHNECAYEPTPPRHLALHCRKNTDDGGQLLLCDPSKVLEQLDEPTKDALRTLTFKTTTRPNNAPIPLLRDAGLGEQLLYSGIYSAGGARQGMWRPASEKEDAAGWKLLDALLPRLLSCPGARRFLWHPGDLLVIANHRIMHGRTPLSGRAGDGHRELAHLRIR